MKKIIYLLIFVLFLMVPFVYSYEEYGMGTYGDDNYGLGTSAPPPELERDEGAGVGRFADDTKTTIEKKKARLDNETIFQQVLSKEPKEQIVIFIGIVLILIFIFKYVLKQDIKIDRNIVVIILIIILVMLIPIKEKEELRGDIVKINKTEKQTELTPEKIVDSLATLGNKVSPDRPVVGWIFIFLAIWVLKGILNIGGGIRDNYFDYKIKSWFRRR